MNQQVWGEELKRTSASWTQLSRNCVPQKKQARKIISESIPKSWIQILRNSVPWQKVVAKRIQQLQQSRKIIQEYIPKGCKNLGMSQFATYEINILQSFSKIYLADIENIPIHYQFIVKLLKGYPNVKKIYFLNCELSILFFTYLYRAKCFLNELKVQGGTFSNQIMTSNQGFWIHLQIINISSVPFSNLGVKRLISLLNLKKIRLNNTNITRDCINIMKKNILGDIEITKQLHFDYGLYLRQLSFLLFLSYPKFVIGNADLQDNYFIYMNNVAKFIGIQASNRRMLEFYTQNPKARLVGDNMTPDKVVQQLKYKVRLNLM